MKWSDLRRSSNVEDTRGGGGGMRGLPVGRVGGVGFVVTLVAVYFIGGPQAALNMLSEAAQGPAGAPATGPVGAGPRPQPAADDVQSQFVSAMLGSTEDVWAELFRAQGRQYVAPVLTMFSNGVRTACGEASSAVGPFYCPPDRKVYIDLSFFNELARMGGPGDFAQAYVIGHEVGHHVQNLLGIEERVRQLQAKSSEQRRNLLQVRVELQADCYAGVWAYHANQAHHVLEPGDVDEGIAAAQAIGDDTLQRNAGRNVTPDAFTHGSSAERTRWLQRGLKRGDPNDCDTFAGGG